MTNARWTVREGEYPDGSWDGTYEIWRDDEVVAHLHRVDNRTDEYAGELRSILTALSAGEGLREAIRAFSDELDDWTNARPVPPVDFMTMQFGPKMVAAWDRVIRALAAPAQQEERLPEILCGACGSVLDVRRVDGRYFARGYCPACPDPAPPAREEHASDCYCNDCYAQKLLGVTPASATEEDEL